MAEETDQSTSPTLLGQLQQAPTRDAAAWQEFVRRYGRQVFQWCQRWGLQPADAEDVTQALLVKMLDRMATFRYDASGSFRGWLRTVTHNAWKKFIAGRARPGVGSGDSGVADQLDTVEARDDLAEEFDR
jgi:RNA polymerase sigma-70 factor (ECF subfamily)